MKEKIIAATAVAGLTLALGTAGVASAHDNKMGRGDKAAAVLGDLVAKGTLTQAQVDAIKKAMSDARGRLKHLMMRCAQSAPRSLQTLLELMRPL